MGETTDDTMAMHVDLALPKGRIEKLVYLAELPEDGDLKVTATMKNIGGSKGYFKFYFLDEDGDTIDKEPDLYINGKVEAGKTMTKNLTSFLHGWNMPDHPVDLAMDLRRET